MWAGYIALVNQQLAANGQPPIGFINPTIYSQNLTSAYSTDFHDIVSGTSGSFFRRHRIRPGHPVGAAPTAPD